MADSDWRRRAAERLRAAPKVEPPRSISAQVAALMDEIAAARAAGKTWQEIRDDIVDDPSVSPDTVRIAYARACRRRAAPQARAKCADPVANGRAPVAPAAKAQATFDLGQRWQDE